MLKAALRMLAAGISQRFQAKIPPTEETISTWLQEAQAHFASRNYESALDTLEKITTFRPEYAEALHFKAIVLFERGDHPGAIDGFRQAISLSPQDAGMLNDFGRVLLEAKEAQEALSIYQQALALEPKSNRILQGLGKAFLALGQAEQARSVLERALEISPQDVLTHVLLGGAAIDSWDFVSAERILEHAIALTPPDWKTLFLYGVALFNRGKLDRAIETLNTVRDLAPTVPDVAFLQGCIELMRGRWDEGFQLYESRLPYFRKSPKSMPLQSWLFSIDKTIASLPEWHGEPLEGRRLLVWVEQGMGDTIMLLRLLPALRDRYKVASIAVLGPQNQRCLIQAACSSIDYIEHTAEVSPVERSFDYHCSIMSLPARLGITTDNIPGEVPYLFVPPEKTAFWQKRLEDIPEFTVGLVWAGNPKFPFDAIRSIPLARLAPLLEVDECIFISLQKDAAASETILGEPPLIRDWIDECHDIVDTAALIMNLDLVIAVDTAVAHLAGALGKSVWLLNRFESEWRWMRDREDSVWYPSMRIFTQSQPREWEPVIARTSEALRTAINERF